MLFRREMLDLIFRKVIQGGAVLEILGNEDALLGEGCEPFVQGSIRSGDGDTEAKQFEGGIEVAQCPALPEGAEELAEALFGVMAFDNDFQPIIPDRDCLDGDAVAAFGFEDFFSVFEQEVRPGKAVKPVGF